MRHKIPPTFIIIMWGSSLLAGLFVIAPAARAADSEITLDVRHDHAVGSCRGKLILSSSDVRYLTDHKKDARIWSYEDIQQWRVGPGAHIEILTYEDRSKWRLGADKNFEFEWTSTGVTPAAVYEFLKAQTKRPIEARLAPPEIDARISPPDEGPSVGKDERKASYEFPVKHLGTIKGNQGRLIFAADRVIYRSGDRDAARTWRYEDIESITSGGIYDLALTTYEREKFHYASRRVYNFQLKTALDRDTYDELWRFVNGKKGLGSLLK
jgi:hypothetical protein